MALPAQGNFLSFAGMGSSNQQPAAEGDDLYTGFQAQSQTPFGNPLAGNPLQPPASSAGLPGFWSNQPPQSSAGIWGQPPQSSAGFMGMGGGEVARPMTSTIGTGYQGFTQFDPMKQGNKLSGPAPPLAKKSENSPEEACLDMERKINTLIEESAQLNLQQDFPLALEKAKEASKKERMLCKTRENYNMSDESINIDLTYSVHFNLAVQYQANQLYTEALNTYSLIVRNKQYAMSGRLRVNMGNIYMEQGKFPLAIKMYRMALDQIPNPGKELKFKIMRNIGNCFVKIGHYQDAIASYEGIMEGSPDIVTGFNLLLCYYATGDKDKLKRHFTKLLNIRKYGATDEDDDLTWDDIEEDNKEAMLDDGLKHEIREKRKQHLNYLLTAGRLIAPMVEKDWQTGFDYIIEQLRHYELKDTSSRLAAEMEMCKALMFMRNKKYNKAIEALKAFEKKDRHLKAKAATNLAYLYFLEGDMENGDKHASLAIEADKYNSKALVNKGNFLYKKGDYDGAKQMYLEATRVEADNIEALYNLGLATKRLQQFEESLTEFKKLQAIVPNSVEVTYQIANLYDMMCDNHHACEWFHRLITRVPTDPNVLARLGAIYAKEEDESQAFHYHLEAYRYFPVNMDVISWLGAHFVRTEVYEKAMKYFDRASQIQPNEIKWRLMVASCYRRIGEHHQAKRMYEEAHKRWPDNAECLRYLIHMYNDVGMKEEATEAHRKLKKLEARLAEQDGFGSFMSNRGKRHHHDDDSYGPRGGDGFGNERTSPPSPRTPPDGESGGLGGFDGPSLFGDGGGFGAEDLSDVQTTQKKPPAKQSASAARHAKQKQLEEEMEDEDGDVVDLLPE